MAATVLEKLSEMDQKWDTRLGAIEDKVKTVEARRVTGAAPASSVPAGAPFGRKGENIMNSRGFSFGKIIGALGTNSDLYRDNAKIELDYCKRLAQEMHKKGWNPDRPGSVLVPIWPDAFGEQELDNTMYHEMKSLLYMGVSNADPQEVAWYEQKMYGQKAAPTAASPAQSWIDQTIGGTFVPPPVFGPPIELLRNMEALMSAGCTVVPLGPSGRITMPRLTGATQGGWSGENFAQTASQAKTGSLNLSAKKAWGIVALPNEILRYASPAIEQVIRNDLFKTVALIMDKGLLDGPGSDNQPLGLATMGAAGAVTATAGSYAASTYGVNVIGPTTANQLAPQDAYTFLAAIEENNGNGDTVTWIMRPQMAYAFYQARWTPYTGGTSQGGFVFEIIRSFDGKVQKVLVGRPIVSTVQVSNKRGSGAQTYVLALQADDYYLGLFGAIEFTQTDAGWTLLSSDQTAVRAVINGDGGMRHPGLVSFCDSLNFVVAP